ncbi:MAG: TonB-dependent receptor plug domain-containing protein [Bernardetiaceae bacterium]
MKKIIFFFLGWMALAHLQAQDILTVLDKNTQTPLTGVTLTHERVTLLTDAAGQVDVSAFREAESIVLRCVGYRPFLASYADLLAWGFVIGLAPATVRLDEVVVSATRWRQASGQIPATLIALDPEEVRLQNPQTTADLLGISGKVFIQKSQQGGGSPMIRGFATNRLLYTVDGVRMNTAIFRGGNLQNVISLDGFAIENTEVLFGPGSVIYGSDAIGGVMSFRTLTPTLAEGQERTQVGGQANLRYASANHENTAHLHFQLGRKKWAALTSFTFSDFDDLRQGKHGPNDYLKTSFVERQGNQDVVVPQSDPLLQIPSAYSQMNFMQKLRFRPNDHWEFLYGFHFSETSSYGRYDRHNRIRNGLPRHARWDYGPQKWQMHLLEVLHSPAQSPFADQISLRLSRQDFGESRIDRNFNNPLQRNNTEAVIAHAINLDVQKKNVYYGIEYVHNDVSSTGLTRDIETQQTFPSQPRYPQAHWQSLGAYLQKDWHLWEQVSLQSGVRYNYFMLDADFETAFFDFPFQEARLKSGALTGNLGATYRPNDNRVWRVQLATAFRSPNVDDMGKIFDPEPLAVVVPNPDLKAEYAYTADVGVAQIIGDVLKLDISAYYTHLDRALVRRNFTLNGQDSISFDGVLSQVQAIQNAAVAQVYGVQLGLDLRLPSGWFFSTDLNFQEGREELDEGDRSPSRHAAPFFGMTRIGYRGQALEVMLYAVYQAERSHENLAFEERNKTEIYALDANGNTYAPAWYTLNLKATYRLGAHIQLQAGLENLTDRRYRPYSSGISGAGRNFMLALQLKS